MRSGIKKWTSWFRNSGIAQTVVGFFSFLIIAAVIMLFLESSETASGIKSLFNSFWFTIVTITTVGYGDMSPLSAPGKIAAVVIMAIGVLYMGVLTGNITSWLVERNRRRVHGLVPVKKKEGHFIILGWRQGMKELLKDILLLHKTDSSYLVLVNDTSAQEVNELRQDIALKEVGFFHGDYTNKEVLLNACGDSASKVLVISDELSDRTAEEIDFRSVLATIAIKRLNPQIYTIAEIIQPKFIMYLQHVDVEEIILNRYSARALLCNIALMSGLNSIFTTFFSLNGGLLRIEAIHPQFIGKTYRELKSNLDQSLVIGLLENTGNLRIRKQEKINLAQKSVSIKKAIEGLIELKDTRSNVPVFHPHPNYIVKENSALIVLKVAAKDLNAGETIPETVILDSAVERSPQEIIRRYLDNSLEKAKNWNSLCKSLICVGVEIYQYGNTISGVTFKNVKYPFETLEYPPSQIEKIKNLFETKQDLRDFVRDRFNQCLKKASDWEGFFSLLQQEGMVFSQYRKKTNGRNIQTVSINK